MRLITSDRPVFFLLNSRPNVFGHQTNMQFLDVSGNFIFSIPICSEIFKIFPGLFWKKSEMSYNISPLWNSRIEKKHCQGDGVCGRPFFPPIKKAYGWNFSFSAQKRPLRSPKTTKNPISKSLWVEIRSLMGGKKKVCDHPYKVVWSPCWRA